MNGLSPIPWIGFDSIQISHNNSNDEKVLSLVKKLLVIIYSCTGSVDVYNEFEVLYYEFRYFNPTAK